MAKMRSLPGRALLACILVACLDKPPGLPESNGKPEPVAIPTQPSATASARPNANPDESKSKDLDRNDEEDDRASPEPTSNKDPFLGGTFTLADATATLSGTGALVATIKTSMGPLKCKLFDDKAPITVANFVGLARGVRPWRARDGRWVKRPIYDGTTFHRVIKGFMIQGGDPNGDGTGEPGYVIPDEIWPGAKHDRPGQLCMANRGPNTNGAQFFITDANGSIPHLDKSYTIFGECEPVSVVHTIARVPTDRSSDRPLTPVTIHTIEITREASGRADAPSAPNAASATKPAPGCSGCGRGDPLSPTY